MDPLTEIIEKLAVLKAEKKKLVQINLELKYKNDELEGEVGNMKRLLIQSEERIANERMRGDIILHENKLLISHISNDMSSEYIPRLRGDTESGYQVADIEGDIEDWKT